MFSIRRFAALKPFQLTAARRRLDVGFDMVIGNLKISTHSRAKAAGLCT